MTRSSFLAVGASVFLLSASTAVALTTAGVMTAANPQVTGTPPAGVARVLEVGSNVVINEVIETSALGNSQVLFRDGSTVTVGPNARVIIDSFVYDPDKRTAKLSMSSAEGLIRVIGGRASKDGDGILIKTPSATVGIRGGIAEVEVDAATGTGVARFLFGDRLTIDTGGTIQTLTTPNFEVTFSPGGLIGAPQIVTPQMLGQSQQQFEGKTNAAGGSDQARQADQNAGLIADANSSATPRDAAAKVAATPAEQMPASMENSVAQTGQYMMSQKAHDLSKTAGFNVAFVAPISNSAVALTSSTSFESYTYDVGVSTQTKSGAVSIDGTGFDLVRLTTDSSTTSAGSTTTTNIAYTFSGNQVVNPSVLTDVRIGAFKNGTIGLVKTVNGAIDTNANFTLSSSILPIAIGSPVSPALMPTSGTFAYALTAATPAYVQNSSLSGIFSGTLTVSILGPLTANSTNLTAGLTGSLDMTAAGGAIYAIAVPNSISGISGTTIGGFSTSTVQTITGTGCTSCSIGISGFLAGAAGGQAALVYQTSGVPVGEIVGTAAFVR